MPPPHAETETATRLLLAAANGDRQAAHQLLPLVYGRLRKSAQIDLGGERLGHTLTRSRVGVAVLRIAELDSELTRDARCSHLRESELLLLEGYQGLREREACIASDGKVRVSEALARANLSSPPAATEKP